MAVNFDIETMRIDVGSKGGFLTVRGMNAEDLTAITTHYLEDAKALVARYAKKGVTNQKGAVAELILELAKDFPSLVLEIISRAADATEAGDVEKLRLLSFPKQIETLRAITILTTEDGGIDLGKWIGAGLSLLESNGVKTGPLRKSLQNIIVTSEKPSPS